MKEKWTLQLGATYTSSSQLRFRVWAPFQDELKLSIEHPDFPKPIVMAKDKKGYFSTTLKGIEPGTLYGYLLQDGATYPDPVSRYLPEGPHHKTQIIDPSSFVWTDEKWVGLEQKDFIFYECHVGTFTREGTFEALIKKLPYLKKLGITAIELMPISQFPGRFNWGYDTSSLYAVQNSYGGPLGLKKLVDAAHAAHMAIGLDVVYNHLSPLGCYLLKYGPYLTDRYKTPWGDAINFDGPYSDEVRNYFLNNALYWFSENHIDFLRLDALHAIFDRRADPFLNELSSRVKDLSFSLNRPLYLFGENDLNDSRLIRSQPLGSNLDGVWNEDFHHAAHVTLTKENQSYYQDFIPRKDLKTVLKNRVKFGHEYSFYRKRIHGNSFEDLPYFKFISFLQNHDQVGNRASSDRLSTMLSFPRQKTAAALLILSPFLPLLFMGEEYGEKAPFLYFVDLENDDLVRKIWEGRKEEFGIDKVAFPDEKAFLFSKLHVDEKAESSFLFHFYQDLIEIRKNFASLFSPSSNLNITAVDDIFFLDYENEKRRLIVLLNFTQTPKEIDLPKISLPLLLSSENARYGGDDESFKLTPEKLYLPHERVMIWGV